MDNRILVGVGPGDEERSDAIARAVRRLATSDDRVVLVHVYAEDDRERIREMLDVDTADPEQMRVAVQHNTAVKAVANALAEADVEPEFRGEFGDPVTVLLDMVDSEDPAFLVVGGRKRSPTGKALFGSTAQQVLLSASCPVVFVKSRNP